MAVYIALFVGLVAGAGAAPPAQTRLYTHPAQTHQTAPLNYYEDTPDVSYYSQEQQNQVSAHGEPEGAPTRLETLDPDSEVELIPGAQAPQQPPQQAPVAPNVPGILPGQRVFIIHMPVPGYRPGTIGGYQPVYIVAAAPEGNLYATNGYQQPGQAAYPSYLGYQRPAPGLAPAGPGFLLGGALSLNGLNRPYDYFYQQPLAYQAAAPAGSQGTGEPGRPAQLVTLQGLPAQHANEPGTADEAQAVPEAKKAKLESSAGNKDEESRRGARPTPPQPRAKA